MALARGGLSAGPRTDHLSKGSPMTTKVTGMSESQMGLPVPGYRPQTNDAVAAVSRLKIAEERILRELDALAADPALNADPRWLATGRTDIEKGFMAVNRSVFKPGRVEIDE